MNITVLFSEAKETEMVVQCSESGCELTPDFGEIQKIHVGGEVYRGEYTVTPKVSGQVVPTKGKLLLDDMTINPIPFFNVSNTTGGSTVYIAKEI